jgi:dolichol-phosphate mannosyltransferase
MKRNLLFIPTLNEAGSIHDLVTNVLKENPYLNVLVIDDNSIDGTTEIIEKLMVNYHNLFLIVRPRKLGVGSAHIEALNFAKRNNYEFLVTMDADGSHNPKYIGDFLSTIDYCDLVIGSRYKNPESLLEWHFHRKLLTYVVHFLTTILLGLSYDCSSGFRCYRVNSIPEIVFIGLKSTGYDFFFESVYEITRAKLKIQEISITLPARTYGSSKLTYKLAVKAFVTLVTLCTSRIKR